MPSAGFATSIPTIDRPQTYTLDRMSTGICSGGYNFYIFIKQLTYLFTSPGYLSDLMMAGTVSRNMPPSLCEKLQ